MSELRADLSIPDTALASFLDALEKGNTREALRFPGDSPARQPVHTVYGGAHLFKADAAQKLGTVALRALQEHAPDAATLAAALGLDPALTARLYPRVVEKLTREPVEDFRIDFEDGFGTRPDAEEDGFAQSTADQVAAAHAAGTLPAGIGIRIKPLSEELKRRSLRTFDLFLTRLVERTHGVLPHNFVVTLPKITSPEQVSALASACDVFEYRRDLAAGTLRFELMIETTQSVFAPDGSVALPRLVAEGGGRIVAAHFGTYDYTAACNITAAHQHMLHPVCDFAKRHAGRAGRHRHRLRTARPTSCRSAHGSQSTAHGAARRARGIPRHRLLSGLGPAPGAAPSRTHRFSHSSSGLDAASGG